MLKKEKKNRVSAIETHGVQRRDFGYDFAIMAATVKRDTSRVLEKPNSATQRSAAIVPLFGVIDYYADIHLHLIAFFPGGNGTKSQVCL